MPNTPGAHPHFNDRGAVRWYTSLADGLAAARGECKKVFIERGVSCPGRGRHSPGEAVKARLNQPFVAVAIDCDQPDPEVQEL